MITAADIKWGSYLGREGPYWPGTQRFILPTNPSVEELYVSVITATEGGSYDSCNMYDRCGVSLGLLQWCEFGQFSVSALLGAVSEVDKTLPTRLPGNDYAILHSAGWRGYRFWFANHGPDYVGTIDEQRKLFFLHATGELGSWDDDSKLYAKQWAAALASIFENDVAKKVQLDFTTSRLNKFVLPHAKMLDPASGNPWTGPNGDHLSEWWHVAYAAYLSFAVNNPTIASRMFQEYREDSAFYPTNKNWVIGLLKKLTFGPQIAIYPGRYNRIRPVLEESFGVDLPDFAAELWAWRQKLGIDPQGELFDRMDTTAAIQLVLVHLGYDLGPAGADDVFGPKTKQAIIAFQRQNHLKQDGIVGPITRRALAAAAGGM